jgi:hypothetical protein
MKVSCDGVSLDKPLLFGSLMLVELFFLIVTRVNSANVLDAGLKIGGKRASDELEGKDLDKQGEAWCVLRKKLVDNWLNLWLASPGPRSQRTGRVQYKLQHGLQYDLVL